MIDSIVFDLDFWTVESVSWTAVMASINLRIGHVSVCRVISRVVGAVAVWHPSAPRVYETSHWRTEDACLTVNQGMVFKARVLTTDISQTKI